MFADAYKSASSYTRPLLILARKTNDPFSSDFETISSVASMVILNDEGWFVTSSHIFQAVQQLQQLNQAWNQLQDQIGRAKSGPMTQSGKLKKIKRAARKKPHEWVSHIDVIHGDPSHQVDGVRIFPHADLALGQIKNFDTASVATYPSIKNPANDFDIGTSLCRLGFPFANLEVGFDEANSQFKLNGPPPLFPIEGIYTRNVNLRVPDDADQPPFQAKLIETSMPGLRGQSGGPIFDTKGRVWGIQSRTSHYPLGFDTEIEHGGKTRTTENAFLHVGLGTHAETVIAALDHMDVNYATA